jgi:ComF family protein
MQWFQRLTSTIADSLWQKNCPICNRPADLILCRDCDRQIAAHQSSEFLQKDAPISSNIPLYSWGIYDGALKRAIAACKYENHPEIMQAIAIKIADQWQRSALPKINPKNLAIVPIPLHANKLKSRGFNQAEIAARQFCDRTGLRCYPQLLQRVKDTKAQMLTKSVTERQENLSQAFTAQITPKQQQVILFDDIYTSGATIREAIATFSKINTKVCGVIVIARPQMTKN